MSRVADSYGDRMNLDPHSSSPTTPAHEDLWRVQLATGEVRAMTLDALDEAFQAGTIDENTRVLAPGAAGWAKLADVAGLADAGDSEPRPEEGIPSLSPMAADVPQSRLSLESLDLSAYDPSPKVPADFEIDENALKAKKGRVAAFVGVGIAAVVGVLFLGAKVAGNLEGVAASNAMRPSAAAAPPAAIDVSDIDARARALSEDQKKRLMEADKAREAARKAKAPTAPAGGRAAPRQPGEKGAPFVNGGDKYDPLNGAL